jgi:hypothetical protein
MLHGWDWHLLAGMGAFVAVVVAVVAMARGRGRSNRPEVGAVSRDWIVHHRSDSQES